MASTARPLAAARSAQLAAQRTDPAALTVVLSQPA
jgi:hypothetical protein